MMFGCSDITPLPTPSGFLYGWSAVGGRQPLTGDVCVFKGSQFPHPRHPYSYCHP